MRNCDAIKLLSRYDIDAAFASSPTAWQQLWQRDRAVLGLAAKARTRRLDVAVQRLGL